jgi:hypothetical protein
MANDKANLVSLNTTPFFDLVNDPVALADVSSKLETIIWTSFGQDVLRDMKAPPITESETKRRFEICEYWIRVMRGDMLYSWLKTMEILPFALRRTLDGLDFTPPPANEGWVVSDRSRTMELDETQQITADGVIPTPKV